MTAALLLLLNNQQPVMKMMMVGLNSEGIDEGSDNMNKEGDDDETASRKTIWSCGTNSS